MTQTLNPTHIRMFDTPEIQEGWTPEVGDRAIIPMSGGVGFYEATVVRIVMDIKIVLTGSQYTYYVKKELIFLPSIEQMAEMWHEGADDCIGWHFYRDMYKATFKITDNCISLFILLKSHQKISVVHWDRSSFRQSHTDCVDRNSFGCSQFSLFQHIPFMIFPIADDDQRLIPLRLAECFNRQVNGIPDRCSLSRDHPRVDRSHKHLACSIIGCNRELGVCFPGKHKAFTI